MGTIAFLDNPFGPTAPAPRKARAQLEAYIERLIAALDALDGDCDLEPSEDFEPDADSEPSLGWLAKEAASGRYRWMPAQLLDAEHDHDGREPDADCEPDSDAEPDADDEPSLGRLETVSQREGTYRVDWVLDGELP